MRPVDWRIALFMLRPLPCTGAPAGACFACLTNTMHCWLTWQAPSSNNTSDLLQIDYKIFLRLGGWGQFSVVRHYMLSVRVVAGRINLVMTIPPSSSVSFSRFKLCKHWSGSRYTQDQKHWARKRWKIINFTLCFYSAYEYLILMISQEESD